jgi:hypothetical protein
MVLNGGAFVPTVFLAGIGEGQLLKRVGMHIVGVDPPPATTAFDGLSKITVGTVEPEAPSEGDLWVDTT